MKLFQLLLLGSVLIPSHSYAMFEEELTDVVYKHWNPGTLPLEKEKNTINFLDLEKSKEEFKIEEIENNNLSSLALFKRESEGKINWKTEKENLATKIYQYWEDKKDMVRTDVVCATTACSILNVEYNLNNINFEPTFIYNIYSKFIDGYNDLIENYRDNRGSHYDPSRTVNDTNKKYYFLRGLIRHLYNIGELDNKRYLENEYKEKAQEIISNHAYTYTRMGSQEELSSDIKTWLGQEGTISSKKSKKIKVQQEKNQVLVFETNK